MVSFKTITDQKVLMLIATIFISVCIKVHFGSKGKWTHL